MHLESIQGNFRSALALVKVHQTDILIALTVLLLLRLILRWLNSGKRNFPPGPKGLPIVGYLPFLSKDPHLDFIELGKKYGGIFSVKLGSQDLVVFNDSEIIKEALTKNEIQGRDENGTLALVLPHSSFFSRNNHVWREQRRFVVQSMKELGLGKSKIEHEIQAEINQLLDILANTKGQPLELKKPLSPSMSNNICALVFGKRYDFSDPIRSMLDTSLDLAMGNGSQFGVAFSFPWVLSIPFVKRILPVKTSIENFKIMKDICRQEIQNHKEDFDSKNVRDFIDSYLLEMQAKKNVPNTSFDEETLTSNVTDLFTAGSESVRTSILWGILIIAAYPEVQKRVHKEIVDVIGSERSPEFLDQKEMTYTHAVILEIMRLKTITPLNVVRCVTMDTKVAGYDIPKGTNVLTNLWNIHHDPKLWDEPDSFKPERFLGSNGKSIVKSSNFIPFSLGKRSCPGETMANMELFLYFTSIIQKFEVTLPEGEIPDLTGSLSLVYLPKPYKMCFIPRT